MLEYLTARDNSEPSNPSELFRLLLHREFNRCKGLPSPKFNAVASDSRIGRMKYSVRSGEDWIRNPEVEASATLRRRKLSASSAVAKVSDKFPAGKMSDMETAAKGDGK
jgi:hypothetical protein